MRSSLPPDVASPDAPVLQVEHLAVEYQTARGPVRAVSDVSFDIHCGEALAVVGESGCGKSSLAYGIVNFLGKNGRIAAGRVVFQGRELQRLSRSQIMRLCGNQIAFVYQDPMQALNPTIRIGEQLSEVLTVHQGMRASEAEARCLEMLERVCMPDPGAVLRRYPHQLSGGQQQRVIIAMALLNRPALLVLDEPTTALDVTVEASVLDLIDELRHAFQTAVIYITHNLAVVARIADRVGVMYAGELAEIATVDEIFARAVHPYTRALIDCIPRLGRSKGDSQLTPIPGRVPAPADRPAGCIFAPRCSQAAAVCALSRPDLLQVAGNHSVRCLRVAELAQASESAAPQARTPGATQAAAPGPALRVEQLKAYYEQSSSSLRSLFRLGQRRYVKALDGVAFEAPGGQTLGIVGESGCGKSTLAKVIAGLQPMSGGSASFLGFDLAAPVMQRDRKLIRQIQMVFQNPDSTLNPSFTVGYQIARALIRFGVVPRRQVRDEVMRLLADVKLDESFYSRYPRQLSGGEKQRVAIARAFAPRPELVLCDEPVSALDVSVQAAVLNLLLAIQQERRTTMLFIAHDLSVVRYFSDTIAVMYLGHICEIGPAEAIYAPPYHPYTEALLSAVPIPDPQVVQKRIRLEGSVPSALNPPAGCPFHTRCPRKRGGMCEHEAPAGQQAAPRHLIYCHIPLEELRRAEPVVTLAHRNIQM